MKTLRLPSINECPGKPSGKLTLAPLALDEWRGNTRNNSQHFAMRFDKEATILVVSISHGVYDVTKNVNNLAHTKDSPL